MSVTPARNREMHAVRAGAVAFAAAWVLLLTLFPPALSSVDNDTCLDCRATIVHSDEALLAVGFISRYISSTPT
ncbi:MAG: hypothetical protein ACE5EO_04120 [Candidatus Krumholzibacteriia bacterium]